MITQQDARQTQLAKAAVYAGVLMPMGHLGVKPIDVKNSLYIPHGNPERFPSVKRLLGLR